MKLSNKTYDILKWVALTGLPALGVLYYTLAGIWGLSNTEHVVGTIAAIETFLGVVLGISSAKYSKENSVDSDANKSDNNANEE